MAVGQWIRGLPDSVKAAIKGAFDWQSSIAITIPGTATGFSTALALPRDFNVIATATGTYINLPAGTDQVVSSYTDANGTTRNLYGEIDPGDTITVVNTTGSTLSVSGYTSAGTIQGASSPYSQATKLMADYRYIGSGNWMVNKSA